MHRLPRMPDGCLIDLERFIAMEKRAAMIDEQIEARYLESDSEDVIE
jgi:hypothetical protein